MNQQHKDLSALAKAWLFVLGACILAAGLFFGYQGARLVALDGSWYFVICGVVLAISGIQIARCRASGGLLYA